MDLRETKIYTNGKARELHKKLIEMGYVWGYDDNSFPTENRFLFFIHINKNKKAYWSDSCYDFEKSSYKEVPAQDILDYEIPKKDWKDELQEGEYLINALLNKNPLVDCTPAHKGIEFFKDKDKAIHAIEVLKLHLEMLRFAEVKNGDWKPDWTSNPHDKYGIEIYNGYLSPSKYSTHNVFIDQISFKSFGIAQEALEIFGDRIRELYNLKY